MLTNERHRQNNNQLCFSRVTYIFCFILQVFQEAINTYSYMFQNCYAVGDPPNELTSYFVLQKLYGFSSYLLTNPVAYCIKSTYILTTGQVTSPHADGNTWKTHQLTAAPFSVRCLLLTNGPFL